MKKVKVIEGVVAEYNGKYWGTQYADGYSTSKKFGDFEKAEISNPEFCTKPTDMTWNPQSADGYNHEYNELSKARLIKVRKTIITEFEIL